MNNLTIQKYNCFFSNLNLILIIIGYPLVATLLIPIIGDSDGATRIITVPYRAFALSISLITLFLNLSKNIKLNILVKLFLFFWILVLLRIFYDLEYRSDYFVPVEYKSQVWLFAISIVFIPMISVLKSFNKINYNICFKYISVIVIIILIFSYFTMIQKTSDFERATGSVALDSISFGQLGGIATIFAIYRLITNKLNPKNKIVCIVFAILGFYILLRSGSRGPLVALIAVLIFFYGFRTKNIRLNFMRIIFILGLLIIFSGLLIQILNFISPLSVSRIVEGVQGNDLSIINRQESYNWFISQIKENIIFGSQFARLSNTNYPGYAHNIFLDILLGFGIFGLLLFLYIIVKTINTLIIMIINHNDKYWIGLLMLYYFITSLFSGTYYSNPVLNLTILLTLLIGANYNNKLHGQKKAQTITIN